MIPKVVSEEVKYKGSWVDIIETKVVLGNGKTDFWEMIRTNDGVATVALDSDNNVYLEREYRIAHRDFIYNIATGLAHLQGSEEELKEEARKELREEMGINARNISKLATALNGGRSTGRWHIYLAQDVYDDPGEMEEGETIEVVKVPVSEAMELLMSNKSHFVALLGVLLAKEKLKL